jgi:hypothetical protein
MKDHSDSMGQSPRRGDLQIPVNGANELVAKFSRPYAEADEEDQFAIRVRMRDIILSRPEVFILPVAASSACMTAEAIAVPELTYAGRLPSVGNQPVPPYPQ